MENAEEVLHYLEEFSKRKPKAIPQELNEYLAYVARTGDPVYQWPLVKSLFKEKLLNVITDFSESTPGPNDIPPYPNVDRFDYELMKNSLVERLDSFNSAPFTVQRISELLTCPRKQYNRVDKFMRAIEKNILVVSTREPGPQRQLEMDNGDLVEPILNGSDNNSDYNVDVEMEDMAWKENAQQQILEPQPGSSDTHISVDDIETHMPPKADIAMVENEEKSTSLESVSTPDIATETPQEVKPMEAVLEIANKLKTDETSIEVSPAVEPKMVLETFRPEPQEKKHVLVPQITIDDAEMTEQKLSKQASELIEEKLDEATPEQIETKDAEVAELVERPQIQTHDDSSSDSNKEETMENKAVSEVSTSSEESSSSSDVTDSSNSPKAETEPINTQDETSLIPLASEPPANLSNIETKVQDVQKEEVNKIEPEAQNTVNETTVTMQSENYTISDVNSELPQPPKHEEKPIVEAVIETPQAPEFDSKEVSEEPKVDTTEEPPKEEV